MTLAIATRAILADETRWTPTRKLQVLNDYDLTDAAGKALILTVHGLTADEIDQWRRAYRRLGLAGLKVTKQAVRQLMRRSVGRPRTAPLADRAPHQNEIEPGRPVVNDWESVLTERWADRKARLAGERAR